MWQVPTAFSLKDVCASRNAPLQVIVKLANIELTPEKPRYEGGTWHFVGKSNEAICATAIYYYSTSNITQSSLAFRQHSGGQFVHKIRCEQDQDEHAWLTEVFGLHEGLPAIQTLGTVATKEGRLISFPNMLQHQVQPFELDDKTKPGHQKILTLFLVAHLDVISTADVPCQRVDWWKDQVLSRTESGVEVQSRPFSKKLGLQSLPPELKREVFSAVEDLDAFPIGMKKAKEIEEALAEQRKAYVAASSAALDQRCTAIHHQHV